MIRAAQFGTTQCRTQRMCGHIGNQVCPGRRTDLVRDHRKTLTLARQAQHGLGKIAATCRIHPAGTKDQMCTPTGANGLLTFELGTAIYRQGTGGIILLPRPGTTAVKHIVGGVMH
ncbi:hypothetical protein SDC9_180254 [bioreactor metagenome]|uniref:Uncharacterized protein n=1 Tax=bioreactor metagenome TaxID=1076179 RepID=A0A645H930_9ZZZZ